MKTQTQQKLKEELSRYFRYHYSWDEINSEDNDLSNIGEMKDYFDEALDRLEKQVREEIRDEAFNIISQVEGSRSKSHKDYEDGYIDSLRHFIPIIDSLTLSVPEEK